MTTNCPGLARNLQVKLARAKVARDSVQHRSAWRAEYKAQRPIASVGDCILLGGYGFEKRFAPGTQCVVDFTEDGIRVCRANVLEPILTSSFSDARALEFSGPGRVREGGGFIGFGLGIPGAIEGLIAADVLNALTTRHSVQTIIRWEASSAEIYLHNGASTPEELRMKLSEVVGRVHTSSEHPRDDVISRLERLRTLQLHGVISDEEFARLKAALLVQRS